jgi:hypothetical protein
MKRLKPITNNEGSSLIIFDEEAQASLFLMKRLESLIELLKAQASLLLSKRLNKKRGLSLLFHF